jgi:SOS response regulatory protein OraA/RecX
MANLRDELTHPVPQMTTFELRNLRETIEQRLAMQTLPSRSRSRQELQQQLTEVIAEQDERARIRHPKTHA